MKTLDFDGTIILHHTASSQKTCEQYYPILRNEHVNKRGYEDIGYHYIIDYLGNVVECRYLGYQGAHCRGHNSHSYGIALIGNYEAKHVVTFAQYYALKNLLALIRDNNKLDYLHLYPHNKLGHTLCPGSNAINMLNKFKSEFNTINVIIHV